MRSAAAPDRKLSRWKASGIHLLISAVIAVAVLTAMLALWYPRPLFEAEGGSGLVLILVGVDIVIGPLITLIIFRSGKPGLRFDLSMIAALQIAALTYGGYVVFEARPAFIAFVADQFEIVRAVELDAEQLREARRAEFRRLPLTGPVLVAVEPPGDKAERETLLLSAVTGGRDLRHFPKYYLPYAEYVQQVLAKGQRLEQVRRQEPGTAKVIEKYLAETGRDASEVLYVPLRARRSWVVALVSAKNGELVKMLLNPEPLER